MTTRWCSPSTIKEGTKTITFDDLKTALAEEKISSDLDCQAAAVRLVYGSDDGKFLPSDLSLSVPSGYGSIFSAAAGKAFFCRRGTDPGYDAAFTGRVSRGQNIPSSAEGLEQVFQSDVSPARL